MSRRRRTQLGLAALLAGAIIASSCSHLGYYTHTVWGGMKVLSKRRPIAKLVNDDGLPVELRRRLARVVQIRDFATQELSLPDNGSYRKYAELGRPYVVWNVVAAPELSVLPLEWCFPVAGCVSYRGYFSERRALAFASRLQRQGYDVSLAGVRAYSTLGWLKDPVLSTFVAYPEVDLAGLIFHELAHQRLYLQDDTPFNESFATAVELEGVRRWLEAQDVGVTVEAYRARKRREQEWVGLVLRYRDHLARTYGEERSKEWKRRRKAELFAALRDEYRSLSESWGNDARYDAWFEQDLNNAHLASIGAYHDLVPAFQTLLLGAEGDLVRFFGAVDRLAGLEPHARAARLEELNTLHLQRQRENGLE